jgi:hypothetical protein
VAGHSGAGRFPGSLARRAGPTHTDDRPGLEYEAARRFIGDINTDNTIDSLLLLRDSAETHGALAHLARAYASEPDEWHDLPFVRELHRQDPKNPEWLVRLAQEKLWRRDSAAAESLFARAGHYPDALQGRALLALQRNDTARARVLIASALAAGADTTVLEAARAQLAARTKHWSAAAAALVTSLKSSRVSFAHPFPHGRVEEVIQAFAIDGPADTARVLITAAGVRRPGWAVMYELDAIAALRLGDCVGARGRFLALAKFGVRRPDAADLLGQCGQLLQN